MWFVVVLGKAGACVLALVIGMRFMLPLAKAQLPLTPNEGGLLGLAMAQSPSHGHFLFSGSATELHAWLSYCVSFCLSQRSYAVRLQAKICQELCNACKLDIVQLPLKTASHLRCR